MSDDKSVKKYFENMPYGGDAKSSEIHGKANQQVINKLISTLVKQYDVLSSMKILIFYLPLLIQMVIL